MLATTTMAATAQIAKVDQGTTDTGNTPRSSRAYSSHAHRPIAMPIGIATMSATKTVAVACAATDQRWSHSERRSGPGERLV